LEATGSASGRLFCSRYAAVLGVGLRHPAGPACRITAVELEATGSASGRLICSRYAAVLGVGLRGGARPLRRTWVARLPPPRDAMHRGLWIPGVRKADDSPPQDLVAPGRSRQLRYPTVTDPEAPPLRPERHIPNSIATMRRRLIGALVSKLPRCPCCTAPIARNMRRKIS
jgi:hypothetical protein